MKDLSALIKALVHNQDLVFQFFFLFARFEYALKRSGFLNKEKEWAEADWDKYSSKLHGKFASIDDKDFQKAVDYLKNNGPKTQIRKGGKVVWKSARKVTEESKERDILRLVKTVRNNLFHGGKYINVEHDVARNECLLKAGISVLDQCLLLSRELKDGIYEAFWEAP